MVDVGVREQHERHLPRIEGEAPVPALRRAPALDIAQSTRNFTSPVSTW